MGSVAIIEDTNDKVVFCFNKQHNKLSLFGGKFEEGETPLECINRELNEELMGLDDNNLISIEEIRQVDITVKERVIPCHVFRVLIHDSVKLFVKEQKLEILRMDKDTFEYNGEAAYETFKFAYREGLMCKRN